ncbi:hypothetical protein LDI01_18480 [Lentilactobacillus diolivorans]|uniref:Uncharacterized protein n=1 Tax=Lentilactobacillus diolivorans TaxID=179838 RepID=A0ABQ0XLI8_9LACO|nr:hypothetical protein LDI01_18480 [Lentilactobacillus diolivorans]
MINYPANDEGYGHQYNVTLMASKITVTSINVILSTFTSIFPLVISHKMIIMIVDPVKEQT